MTVGDVLLLLLGALVILVAVYEAGKTVGFEDGWRTARNIWRGALDRERESADFWKAFATGRSRGIAPAKEK